MNLKGKRLAFAGVGLLFASLGPGAATQAAPARAAAVQALYDCKKLAGEAAQLECYANATDGLEKAEQSGQIVIVDKELIRAKRKEGFGLKMPTLTFGNETRKDVEPVGLMTFEIDHTSRNGDGMMTFVTTSGAVWHETDNRDLPDDPAKGSKLVVRRGSFGSYFCTAAKMFPVQCKRVT